MLTRFQLHTTVFSQLPYQLLFLNANLTSSTTDTYVGGSIGDMVAIIDPAYTVTGDGNVLRIEVKPTWVP